MEKLQESIFSIVKTTSLSPAVFNYLQPTEEFPDKNPLGGIFKDTRYGWLALGPKFCVIDLKTGLKIAAWTFGAITSNYQSTVKSVVELPTPLTDNSQQLVISLDNDTLGGLICVFHVNGSHVLRCIQTDTVVTKLAVFDSVPDGVFSCFDGVVVAGTNTGEIFVFDLNRECLLQALKYTSQGCENLVHNEMNFTALTFLPLTSVTEMEDQREVALENSNHITVLLNENSFVEGQYIFWNPDGSVRMKAKRDHIWVSALHYIPQLGSVVVGYNFGAFQIWNLLTLELEFTSPVNVECFPVTHFGFQEPCDDPRAFCYLWVVYSVMDRFEEEEFPLAVMYSLTYHCKRMLSDSKCLYQEFLNSTMRFQVELSSVAGVTSQLVGGRCIACHTYSIMSTLGDEGEDSILNICQLVWECWGVDSHSPAHYGMLLFDLDQWYKDQMPSTYQLQNNTFMGVMKCSELPRDAAMLDVALAAGSLSSYAHATRLEEHFYPNSLQYSCVCLSTSEACVLSTVGVQRDIIGRIDETGPTVLLQPAHLYRSCVAAGLTPLYADTYVTNPSVEEQRKFLLSVALEARLSRFLKRCAHDWATGSHSGAGCTLTLLLDWCWQRAIDLKQNARELTAPLFTSSVLPDRNVCRCLEHCVRQLTQLTSLLDAVLTKCCNLVVPDALSEIEEKYKGIGTVALYFQVVQWFLNVGLLPERQENLPYPGHTLINLYRTRRLKLHRLQNNSTPDVSSENKSCPLLYIDQLIANECGGEIIHKMWRKGGSECEGLYPPPSLYSLLRLYLLPDIAEEHKHSLVLYLLVDYSMVYDELRYETVIRRLMQFPTMFGLSNTAIKATQAFWHLDHRDFDFALDQLQCLTGNSLSEWQHNVVLSALLVQKKTQAALQYLHVRKPAPIQMLTNRRTDDANMNRVNDHDKLEDWQSCCDLYLARGLVFEALDVIRLCAQNVRSVDDKMRVLNFFFKGCRNTGQLSKILQIILLPFEEEVLVKYLENCHDQQTSDILVMYYLQQARYVEAQQYNNKIRRPAAARMEIGSLESLLDTGLDRDSARDVLVDLACAGLPAITNRVVQCAINDLLPKDSQVFSSKPMSVSVQAKSPKNTSTYKSSFIQDTIENASETWMSRPKTRRGIKRALNIEETPFICSPKLHRTRSILYRNLDSDLEGQSPPKRAKLDLAATPRTPKNVSSLRLSAKLTKEIETLLEMPEVQTTPDWNARNDMTHRSLRESTPHSILKVKRSEVRDNASPVDSRYLGESDDELLETASNHTHCSDSKHLRFTIPSNSDSGSTPSPSTARTAGVMKETNIEDGVGVTETDVESEMGHHVTDTNAFESPLKKFKSRNVYKDNVRARSLSISVNSSLTDDPSTSIESIADIPITLINPKYTSPNKQDDETIEMKNEKTLLSKSPVLIKGSITEDLHALDSSKKLSLGTPSGRRGIRNVEDVPTSVRSRSVIMERRDSPVALLKTRSCRSLTPELEASPKLDTICEQPQQESELETHAETSTKLLRMIRTPRTPERSSAESKLEAIAESSKSEIEDVDMERAQSLTHHRNLRSRSRTPEVQVNIEVAIPDSSPRNLRSRSKTPERDTTKLLSLKTHSIEKSTKNKKPLSRLVLEANTLLKAKTETSEQLTIESPEVNISENKSVLRDASDSIECTPVKDTDSQSNLLDISFSPIVNKSVLTSAESLSKSRTELKSEDDKKLSTTKTLNFTPINETSFDKSVLKSYFSSFAESVSDDVEMVDNKKATDITKPKDDDISGVSNQSVLKDVSSLITSDSDAEEVNAIEDGKHNTVQTEEETANILKQEKQRIGEIEREIDEIEEDISEESDCDSDLDRNIDSETDEDSDEDVDVEEDRDTTEESEFEEHDEDEEEAVISIIDSSCDEQDDKSSSSSQSNKLQIVENEMEVEEQLTAIPVEVDMLNVEERGEFVETNREAAAGVINVVEESNSEVDPLNQANYSIMTDDNSAVETEETEIKLNYSNDDPNANGPASVGTAQAKVEDDVKADTEHTSNIQSGIMIHAEVQRDNVIADKETICNVQIDIVQTEKQTENVLIVDEETISNVQADVIAQTKPQTDSIIADKEIVSNVQVDIVQTEPQTESVPIVDKEAISNVQGDVIIKTKRQTDNIIADKEISSNVQVDIIQTEPQRENMEIVQEEYVSQVADIVDTENLNPDIKSRPDTVMKEETAIEGKQVKSPGRTRKRTQSTSSNKSTVETIDSEQTDSKTSLSSKQTKSAISQKSTESETQSILESQDMLKTPSRGKRTPSPSRVLTRRMSKELSESKILEEEPLATPRRRTRSKKSVEPDDKASIVSEESINTTLSKASAKSGDSDMKPRKTRRSILSSVKPDLSVIPETTHEDSASKGDFSDDIISEYSKTRRLTRNQKAKLETLLSPKQMPAGRVRSRRSTATSNISTDSIDESPEFRGFDVEPIDPMTLLNKTDFEGTPDADELHNKRISPGSASSDSTIKIKPRSARAASETKIAGKSSQPLRRLSMDILKLQSEMESPVASPGTAADSPVRTRRASFHRAIEALSTPKSGRRRSVDTKKSETDSLPASPAQSVDGEIATTPSRRSRRVASTQSNTSIRSKKSATENTQDLKNN